MKKFLSCFHPKFATSLVYMLQASEYNVGDFLDWFWRANDLVHVASRGRLEPTSKARLLLNFLRAVMVLQIAVLIWALMLAATQPYWLPVALLILATAPLFGVYSLVVILWLGRVIVQAPRERAIIATARQKLVDHQGLRIGIAGSYGKTSFKEMLKAILAEGKIVAATPGNMNTPLGISRFVEKLSGKEEILIFELGEYYPGDIRNLCELVHPQLGIITGINEAHLAKFKTLSRTTDTIFELADFLGEHPVYKNGDNEHVRGPVAPDDPLVYSEVGVNGWSVSGVKVNLDSTEFEAKKGDETIKAKSGLLGRQQVGPLVACIDIASQMGLSATQIMEGIAKTQPYEHRMQPREIAGAWVIDDTYNGNSDGVAAGLEWLRSVPARRRIYVTPGLVEQGDKTEAVHVGIGKKVAGVVDEVVLIQNSVTAYIQQGLEEANFKGKLTLIADPMKFYTNLDSYVATGDVVLMQNDWTDNYS